MTHFNLLWALLVVDVLAIAAVAVFGTGDAVFSALAVLAVIGGITVGALNALIRR